MRRVDVQNAQLTFWPPALGRFSGLTSINLAGNAITFIPQSIEALTGLQVRCVPPGWHAHAASHTQLAGMHAHTAGMHTHRPHAFNCKRCLCRLARCSQSLVMARNSLASVPPELGGLTALTELDLSGNQLRALPRTLGRLTGLQVRASAARANRDGTRRMLALQRQAPAKERNTTLCLPSPPSAHPRQALNVMGNQLTALPEDFGGMTSLLRLGLKSNQLTQLPDSFCRLTRLVELFITDNQLTTLPAGEPAAGRVMRCQLLAAQRSQRCCMGTRCHARVSPACTSQRVQALVSWAAL